MGHRGGGEGNYFGSLKVDKFYYTSPAGSFAANKLGLHDMGGNVGEWCEDKYAPTIGKDRVKRGASWGNFRPDYLSSSYRHHSSADFRSSLTGFRVVLVGE